MPRKFLLAAVALCLYACHAAATEVEMCVDTLLQRVFSHNMDVIAARSGYRSALQGINVARSARLPEISVSADFNYIGDGTILDRNFSNAMRDRLPHFGNTLSVNLYQPIYQGGAITAGIDIARWQAELSAIGVDSQTDASAIEALGTYFNLTKMHNLRAVYQENIQATHALIDNMTERHRQGTVLKNDVTRYELRLSSLNFDLQSIENSISVLNHNLASLLGLEPGTTFRPTSFNADPQPLSESYWQALTHTSSHELRSIDAARHLSEAMLRMERASRLPSVGIVIGNQLTGPVTFEIPALNKNYNYWFAGVSIKYSLSSLWKANKKELRRRMEIAHISDQRNAMCTALDRRIHEAYIALEQACQMLDTEKVNVRMANENYSVVLTRFDNDMALLTDMLDASTAKLDAETRLVNARINMLQAYYQLKFISGSLYTTANH